MSLTEDKLEILIGKCLDGRATPMERHLFEKEINQNPHARELYENWQTLNEWGRGLVVDKLTEQGACPEDVFEQAWRRSRGVLWFRLARSRRHMRFAVGVAAGFLLGVLLHFVWTTGTMGGNTLRRGPVEVAKSPDIPPAGNQKVVNDSVIAAAQTERRDTPYYYGFTDAAGRRYLYQQPVQQQGRQSGKGQLAAYSL
jgi:hypothetical protein